MTNDNKALRLPDKVRVGMTSEVIMSSISIQRSIQRETAALLLFVIAWLAAMPARARRRCHRDLLDEVQITNPAPLPNR